MNEFTTAYLKSEFDYRTDKIRAGIGAKGRRGHAKLPRLRRVSSTDTLR